MNPEDAPPDATGRSALAADAARCLDGAGSAEQIFHRAVDLPPALRAEYVRNACGSDEILRANVEALLRSDAAAPSRFLPGQRVPEPVPERLPLRIGRYRIQRVIGEGGMGLVYEAEHDRLHRRVALKVVRAGLVSHELMRRFLREQEVLAQLQHPNIAQLYEAGMGAVQYADETAAATRRGSAPQTPTLTTPPTDLDIRDEGPVRRGAVRVPFFAMELVQGRPLTEFAAAHKLTPRQCLTLFVPICAAVHHAHQHGVVHRDLKPGNIFVGADGLPKVLDFGVARLIGTGSETLTLQTDVGQILGTVPYMSPEQVAGHVEQIDARSDIYALGAVLYELLTGRTPHDVRNCSLLEAARMIQEEEPSRLRAFDSRLRGDIETIVLKALEKDKARRYLSAADLAADIRHCLADEPIVARPASTFYQVRKFAKRHKALCGAVATIFLVLLGATIVSATMYVHAEAAHQQAHEAEARALERLCEARLAQARASRSSIYAGRRVEALDAITEAARIRPSLALRNEALAAFNLVDVRPLRDVGSPVHAVAATFDPGGNVAVIVTEERTVQVRRVSDGAEMVTYHTPGGYSGYLQTSADGHLLAIGRPGEQDLILGIFHVPEERPLFEIPGVPGYCLGTFAPDSRVFAVGQADRLLHLYDVPSGHELRRIAVADRVSRLVFSSDGRRLAVGSTEPGPPEILDVETNDRLDLADAQQVWALAWRPDGRVLAAGCHDRHVRLYDTSTGNQVAAWSGHTSDVVAVTFNHRGDLLLSRSWDGTSRLWDVSSGSEILRLAQWVDAFGPDDRSLLAWRTSGYDWQPCVAALESSDQFRTLKHEARKGSFGTGAAFLANGRLLLTGVYWGEGADSGARIWDVARGAQIGTLPMKQCRRILVAPDESCICTSGDDGLLRWPIARHENHVAIGPPRELVREMRGEAALSANGRRLVVLAGWRTDHFSVFDPCGAAPPLSHACERGASSPALSPSGRWLALAKFDARDVEVWDLERDARDVILPTCSSAFVAFSPDERWLAVSGATTATIWEVGSWQPRHSISATRGNVTMPMAFSPDGRCMAILCELTKVSLFSASDFSELATLELPESLGNSVLAFSPLSDLLAVTTQNADVVELLDLRRARANLAGLGLDYDLPPYPLLADAPAAPPLTISVVP